MHKLHTVCIIDDDPIYVFTTRKRLEMNDLCDRILIFNNGKDAYEALKKMIDNNEPLPEVILLDINMPVWDGWDFLNEFESLATNQQVNIFIVSSSDNPDDIARSKSYHNIKNFFVKPLNVEQLMEELA